jgi:hypothetical protein
MCARGSGRGFRPGPRDPGTVCPIRAPDHYRDEPVRGRPRPDRPRNGVGYQSPCRPPYRTGRRSGGRRLYVPACASGRLPLSEAAAGADPRGGPGAQPRLAQVHLARGRADGAASRTGRRFGDDRTAQHWSRPVAGPPPRAAELSAFEIHDSLLGAVTSRLASDPSPARADVRVDQTRSPAS